MKEVQFGTSSDVRQKLGRIKCHISASFDKLSRCKGLLFFLLSPLCKKFRQLHWEKYLMIETEK